jgi:hypothetical protein
VDEFLVNLPHAGLFAPGVQKLRGTGEVVAFRCTGSAGAAGEEWRVRLDPDGFRLLGPADRAAAEGGRDTVAVHGQAADLLLLLYGRRSPQEPAFDVSGRAETLDLWVAHTAF